MIPFRDNRVRKVIPFVTISLVFLNVIIFLWDRQWSLLGSRVVFADLTLRPKEIYEALQGVGDRFALVTIFTSLFLHGSVLHLASNMLFLVVFGTGVEEAIGSTRYAIYYLAWGLAATATHIYIDPNSVTPTLGASGAIGGVLGAYFLLFPGNKIEVFIPLVPFLAFEISAWVLLGVWFLWQVLVPQEGVANWAHIGGFLAGMVTILMLGGREFLLRPPEKNESLERTYEFP